MNHDETSGKNDAAADAGQATEPGDCGNVGTGLASGVAARINEAWQAKHPIGVLVKPPTTDTCEILGGDSRPYRVGFHYKNHRGEVGYRVVIPVAPGLVFGSSEWHREPQYLLTAYDLEKRAQRTFAMKDIKGWTPLP